MFNLDIEHMDNMILPHETLIVVPHERNKNSGLKFIIYVFLWCFSGLPSTVLPNLKRETFPKRLTYGYY